VECEDECASVGVDQEAVTPAATTLVETCSHERREDPPRGHFREPGHRLSCDNHLDGDERLAGRPAPLFTQRGDVELKCGAGPSHSLPSRSTVDVAARYLRDRGDEAAVALAIDGDDVAESHAATMSDEL